MSLLSTFPHFAHSPTSLAISFDHLVKTLLVYTHGKCFLFASRATDTIGFALTSSLRLQFCPVDTKPMDWFRDEYICVGVVCYFWTSGRDTTLRCLNEVTPTVAEIRPKFIRYQMVRPLKIALPCTQGCTFHVPQLVETWLVQPVVIES